MKDTSTQKEKKFSVLDFLKKNNPEIPITSAVVKKYARNPRKAFREKGHLFTPSKTEKLLKPFISAGAMKDIKEGNVKAGSKLVQRGNKYVLAAEGGLITDKKNTLSKQRKTKNTNGKNPRKGVSKYSCGLFK